MSLLDKICQALIKMIRKKDSTKLVWKNASPTSVFVKQSITINADANDLVTIVHEGGSTSAKPGKCGHLFYDEYTTGWVIEHRSVSVHTDNVSFETAYTHKGYAEADATNNSKCIPLAIYVTKLGGVLRNLLQTFARGCFVCLAY